MDLIPCSANTADGRGREAPPDLLRARRLVQVKFVALPMDATAPSRRSPILDFVYRVIGRLVAARP